MVRLPEDERESTARSNVLKSNSSGADVPLTTVANVTFTQAPTSVERNDDGNHPIEPNRSTKPWTSSGPEGNRPQFKSSAMRWKVYPSNGWAMSPKPKSRDAAPSSALWLSVHSLRPARDPIQIHGPALLRLVNPSIRYPWRCSGT